MLWLKGLLGGVWGWFLPSSLIGFLTSHCFLFGDEVEAEMGLGRAQREQASSSRLDQRSQDGAQSETRPQVPSLLPAAKVFLPAPPASGPPSPLPSQKWDLVGEEMGSWRTPGPNRWLGN